MIGRRDFLISMVSAGIGLLTAPAVGHSNTAGSDEWVDTWLSDNTEGEELPEIAATPANHSKHAQYCPGYLRLRSSIHGEAHDFKFRDINGVYDQRALLALSWFLRCRDGSWQHMDIKMLESLNYLSALLEVPIIQINSGYRSPRYNKWLASKNENTARNSLHMNAQAVDFFVPGISAREVCSYSLYARNAIGYGGVGYYPKSGFVHLDSGRIHQWAK